MCSNIMLQLSYLSQPFAAANKQNISLGISRAVRNLPEQNVAGQQLDHYVAPAREHAELVQQMKV